MTTAFHPWANLAFVEIEDSRRGKKSLRAEERAYHLASLFCNRQDVGVPPKIKGEFETKESFEAWVFLKGRILHLNRAKTRTVPLVMEGSKICFLALKETNHLLPH